MWFITMMERLEPDEVGWPYFGVLRTVGFYECYEDAHQAVINNACDIHEYCYNYAVIEHYDPGLYTPGRPRKWYKYDKVSKKYLPIEEPDYCARIINMAFG